MSAAIRVQRPGAGEFGKHYQTYVDRVPVRALAYVIAGYERHHVAILRERYGVGAPSSS